MPDVPHFAFPFTIVAGKAAVVEQDSADHVMSCENVIVRCPTGFRQERPEFGWPFPEFGTTPLDLTGLQVALQTFEPRGRADVSEWADEADAAVRHVEIKVEGVTTDGA